MAHIRAARQKFARSKIVFNDQVLEQVAATSAKLGDELDHRHLALENCLKKLPQREREMIMARYQADGTVEDAAKVSGRSMAAAYKALARVRRLLWQCVSRQLATGAL